MWKLHVAWVVCAAVLVVRAWPSLDTAVDDAFISARYAENLARGWGLVYNPRDVPVEGVSNLLWTVLLALGHLAHLPARLTMTGLGLLFAVLTLPGSVLLTRELDGRPGWWCAVPPAALALSPNFAIAGTNGLESSMFAATITWASWATLAARGRWRGPAALLVASLSIVRPEGLALTAALACADVWRRRGEPRSAATWVYPGLAASALVALEVWRWTTYGALVPNTVAAKVSGGAFRHVADNWEDMWRLEGTFWPAHGLVLVASLLAARRHEPFRWVLAAMAAVVVASMFRVFEWMPCGRLLIPVLPLELALLASAGAALSGTAQRAWALLATVVALAGLEPHMEERCRIRDQRMSVLAGLEDAGRHLRRRMPGGETAYVYDAGLFAYALGPRVRVAEAHPRALTQPHPGGKPARFKAYTPRNPGIIVTTRIVGKPDVDSASADDAMWAMRDAEYHYLGRVEMHQHRLYEVYTRADLDIEPFPASLVRSYNGMRDGAVLRAAPDAP